MLAGITLRTKPVMQPISGWTPESPLHRSTLAAVATGHTDIKSGMLISQNTSDEWVKGYIPGTTVNPCFDETDALDPDVVASGKLAGLSCSGQFGLLTGYFVTGGYDVGDALAAATGGDAGSLKVATTGETIIARVGVKKTIDLGGTGYTSDPTVVSRAASLGVSASEFAGSVEANLQNSEAADAEMLHVETNFAGVLAL